MTRLKDMYVKYGHSFGDSDTDQNIISEEIIDLNQDSINVGELGQAISSIKDLDEDDKESS